jgi:mRNA-degrading endonuclease RelE of RelBE toxin-antitoxin system
MELIYLKSLAKDLKIIKDKKLLKSLASVFINLEDVNALFEVSSVKKLSGHPETYSIRVGDYNLGIFYSEETISIACFLKRGGIYKLFS